MPPTKNSRGPAGLRIGPDTLARDALTLVWSDILILGVSQPFAGRSPAELIECPDQARTPVNHTRRDVVINGSTDCALISHTSREPIPYGTRRISK